MHSKRSLEGYILIHNEGPTVPRHPTREFIGAGVKGTFEAPVLTCSHCQAQLLVNPLRTRDRPHCRKCDRYLCDGCAAVANLTGECTPMKKIFDQAHERALKEGA